jgi:hypothetical protein
MNEFSTTEIHLQNPTCTKRKRRSRDTALTDRTTTDDALARREASCSTTVLNRHTSNPSPLITHGWVPQFIDRLLQQMSLAGAGAATGSATGSAVLTLRRPPHCIKPPGVARFPQQISSVGTGAATGVAALGSGPVPQFAPQHMSLFGTGAATGAAVLGWGRFPHSVDRFPQQMSLFGTGALGF